ncbi:MAG: hypothetical protein BroJett013_35950 [Alphaproteobacteria bacterium]|nr:MAG: hypothetical protein BroJett013_35950 [Alphaproteobacteria bacterium]
MIKEAQDFLAESAALDALLVPLSESEFEAPTQFKDWTVSDVLQHLHVWNCAAAASASDESKYDAMVAERRAAESLRAFERGWIGDVRGQALRALWREGAEETAAVFGDLDPARRLKWAGPSMSARSSITARQMETWAHGQAVFDLLGVERVDHDRLRNIAHLGVSTFRWTYAVRGRTPPPQTPYVELAAPSGELWTWNGESAEERVCGSATEFCQVVTQTRNIADTGLQVVGPVAREWMSMAQCFAGAASDPPAPGARFRKCV